MSKSRNNRGNGARARTHAMCRRYVGVNPAAIAAGELASDQHRRNIAKCGTAASETPVIVFGKWRMYRLNPMDDIASLLAMHAAHPRQPGVLHRHAEVSV